MTTATERAEKRERHIRARLNAAEIARDEMRRDLENANDRIMRAATLCLVLAVHVRSLSGLSEAAEERYVSDVETIRRILRGK